MSPRFSFHLFLPFPFPLSFLAGCQPSFIRVYILFAHCSERATWDARGEQVFFIIFNCSVHYPMQIKIIRRLNDAFIFHFPMYLSVSSSLFAPLCSSLSLAVAAFTRITPFATIVSFLFPVPCHWLSSLFVPFIHAGFVSCSLAPLF